MRIYLFCLHTYDKSHGCKALPALQTPFAGFRVLYAIIVNIDFFSGER